jgi:hypothetical protein
MFWLVKNIGLITLSAVILFCGASLEIRLTGIENKLDKALAVESSLNVYANALPLNQLRERVK